MGSPTPRKSLAILDVCRVGPASSNPPEFSSQLTYFDILWLRILPVESLFFYHLPDSNLDHFNTVVVPQLKRSLSVTLSFYFPLAGRIRWPPHDPLPSVFYKFPDDSVSVTVGESVDPGSFVHLAGRKPCKAAESRNYLPELHVTDSEADVISLQVTLFPGHGLAIGISAHHGVLDGTSLTLFRRSWAYINQRLRSGSGSSTLEPSLPPELNPFHDRSAIPDGLASAVLDAFAMGSSTRSLKLFPALDLDSTLVRETFEVSPEDVTKLRALVLSKLDDKTVHLSTFVLVFSHTVVCLAKAEDPGRIPPRKIRFGFPVEARARLDPPVPSTYIGNCVGFVDAFLESKVIQEGDTEEVLVDVARKASEGIRGLGSKSYSVYEAVKGCIREGGILSEREARFVGVAASPRFEFYKLDFGWGRPVKVEITSIDRTGSISVLDRRDGPGGVEIGVVMTKAEMEVFETLFEGFLKKL